MNAVVEVTIEGESAWCGHDGPYQVIAHMCGRRAQDSDQLVKCRQCGREYLASDLRAWRRAAAAGDDADRCKHLMLRGDCVDCRPPKPRAPRQAKPARSSVPDGGFEARYGGRCAAGCGSRIEPGEWIVRDGGGYSHATCADGTL